MLTYVLKVCLFGFQACGGNHLKEGYSIFLLAHLLVTVFAPVPATALAAWLAMYTYTHAYASTYTYTYTYTFTQTHTYTLYSILYALYSIHSFLYLYLILMLILIQGVCKQSSAINSRESNTPSKSHYSQAHYEDRMCATKLIIGLECVLKRKFCKAQCLANVRA